MFQYYNKLIRVKITTKVDKKKDNTTDGSRRAFTALRTSLGVVRKSKL